eukprot:TRINITY_DN198_c1_g2_i1.p1 TRINITY_DN198_c1_g2~~TRINITY_DN198_c1_g2_i1.p1  ORF type:complete len:342 (+),score=42.64 TRINITY_DN198_c1_g2_i1:50-1075(+)
MSLIYCQQKTDCISPYEFSSMPQGTDGKDAVIECNGGNCRCHTEFEQATSVLCTKLPGGVEPYFNVKVEALWTLQTEYEECNALISDSTWEPNEVENYKQHWLAKLEGQEIVDGIPVSDFDINDYPQLAAPIAGGGENPFLEPHDPDARTSENVRIICGSFRAIKTAYFRMPSRKDLIQRNKIQDAETEYQNRVVTNDFTGTPTVKVSFGTPYCPVFPPAKRAALFGGVCQIAECVSTHKYEVSPFLETEPTCVDFDEIIALPQVEQPAQVRSPDGSINDQFLVAGGVMFVILVAGLFFQLFGFCRSRGGLSNYHEKRKFYENEGTEPAGEEGEEVTKEEE